MLSVQKPGLTPPNRLVNRVRLISDVTGSATGCHFKRGECGGLVGYETERRHWRTSASRTQFVITVREQTLGQAAKQRPEKIHMIVTTLLMRWTRFEKLTRLRLRLAAEIHLAENWSIGRLITETPQ